MPATPTAPFIRPDDFDPRGRFIKRLELSEADWRAYEKAFTAAFKRVLKESI